MNTRMLLSFGFSALVLGGATVGLAGVGIASAGKQAPQKDAARAGKALAKHDAVTAIGFAEAAVAFAPTRADYRLLLAQSYLSAGRFASARDAYADVLRLTPDDGKAALKLVLAQIATGDWQAARTTLDAHAATIAPSDRGLALALAGDPAGGVKLLTAAAREPGADAKVRQNLGLALALAGEWPMARVVAATDLSPADVDARMAEWARFAQPAQASDQVAALLGVRAIEDHGQPVALALVAPAAVAAVEPPAMAAPVVPVVDVKTAAEAQPVVAAPVLSAAKIVFAARHEVVQPLPMAASPLLLAAVAPIKVAAGSPVRVASGGGDWVVQLGAFGDAHGARNAWNQATRRFAGLGTHQPQEMAIKSGGATLHRLSVAGFDRAGADSLCAKVRTRGGVCFVRRGAGDRLAQWLRTPTLPMARG